MLRERKWRPGWLVAAAVVGVVSAGLFAAAASAAVPQNTASPATGGTAREGSTLTASTGT